MQWLCCVCVCVFFPPFSPKIRRIKIVDTVPETAKIQISKPFLVWHKRTVYKRDFWANNTWLTILFRHWLLTVHSKWNMTHFSGINEAPPHHQLCSLRRHGANKHSQFKRVENKSSTKGSPWSWAIASPLCPPTTSTHPHRSPTVSISVRLCHANDIESANIKKNVICYHCH